MGKRKFLDDEIWGGSLDPVVVEYSFRLKRLYIMMRHRFDPGYMTVASSENKVLTDLSQVLYQEGIDPSDFVRFCFMEYYAGYCGRVMLGMMKSHALIAEYKATLPDRNERIRKIVEMQCGYVEAWMANGYRIERILTGSDFSLSGVMRYCIAKSFGLTDLLPMFEEDARMTVTFSPQFWGILGKFLPREWRDGDKAVQGSRTPGAEDFGSAFGAGQGGHGQGPVLPGGD